MFEQMFTRLLGHEGGYVDDVNDPGGETNWGISSRSYRLLDIKNLTEDQAKVIYKRDFWDAIEADSLPKGVAFQLFDFAVNSGIQTALRIYQRVLGVADDGHFGPHSLAASKVMPVTDQIMLLVAARLRFMTKCKGWKDFNKGWAERIAKNLCYGAEDS